MNSLPQTLTFNETELSIIDRAGCPWLSAADLAKALGYKQANQVTRIYARNEDEFTAGMSEKVKLTLSGNLQKETRIFSPRGCHLIAMFARTKVAKAFRRWVLDVLDKLNAQIRLSHKDDPERQNLAKAVKKLVAISNRNGRSLNHSDAWGLVHAHMNVQSVDELATDQVGRAVEYVGCLLEGELLPREESSSTLPEFPLAALRHTELNSKSGHDLQKQMERFFYDLQEAGIDCEGAMRLWDTHCRQLVHYWTALDECQHYLGAAKKRGHELFYPQELPPAGLRA